MYFYLIYTSLSRKPLPVNDLLLLLEQSQRNNAALEITGLLLYMDTLLLERPAGRFIQMLEGPETVVRMMYERICTDSRHRGVLLLTTGTTERRHFERWSMGFQNFNLTGTEIQPGFMRLNDELFRHEPFTHSDEPLNYLKAFYQINDKDIGVVP
jgi:hypothetical protein